jgi:hypothetical protein
MHIVKLVGDGDELSVEAVVAGLFAADEQDGNATRVERVKMRKGLPPLWIRSSRICA